MVSAKKNKKKRDLPIGLTLIQSLDFLKRKGIKLPKKSNNEKIHTLFRQKYLITKIIKYQKYQFIEETYRKKSEI